MTKFVDGPAKGQTLMLHRAVKFLRVTQSKKNKWDALDRPNDTPTADEQLYAYQITKPPGVCHVNAGKASGFYSLAEYKVCEVQPMESMMRNRILWEYWCEHQADPCPDWKP